MDVNMMDTVTCQVVKSHLREKRKETSAKEKERKNERTKIREENQKIQKKMLAKIKMKSLQL